MSLRPTHLLLIAFGLFSGCLLEPQEEPPAAPEASNDGADHGAPGEGPAVDGDGDRDGTDGEDGQFGGSSDAGTDPDSAPPPSFFGKGLDELPVPGSVGIPRPGTVGPRVPDDDDADAGVGDSAGSDDNLDAQE
jgi:hypothetical protein